MLTPPAGPSDPYQNYPKTFDVICEMNCNDNIAHQSFRPQLDSVIVNPYLNNTTTGRTDLLVPDNMIPNYIGFKVVASSTGGNANIYNYDFLELKSLGYKFYVYKYINGNPNNSRGQGFTIYLCKNNSCPWPPQDYY